MNQRLASLAASLIVASLVLGGCATTQGTATNALGITDAVLRQANADNRVSLQLSPPEVRTGDAIAAQIKTSSPGYLYLYQIATDGNTVSLVFPNAVDGANQVPGGNIALPRPNWRMATVGPVGLGYFVAVVSKQPQDLMAIEARSREGKIAVDGPYSAAMAMFRETPR